VIQQVPAGDATFVLLGGDGGTIARYMDNRK
jgi:hypothetical protein